MNTDQSNWIERLTQKIPGYAGYASRENRRDVDKLHREHLADDLRATKSALTDVVRELSSSGRLFETGAVERLVKKLDGLENRVRFASYGYAGFFDTVKVDDAQLAALYQFDLMLTENVGKLLNDARALKSKSATTEALKAATGEMETSIDEFTHRFDERHRVIENFNAQQGRPFNA
ncbi:MAG: hypothetical protein NVSMB56_11680 [Pyrinomonadaceae bacterium]